MEAPMPTSDIRIKRRVWVGLAVACAGVGAWALWNRFHPVAPAREEKQTQPFVQLASAGPASGDQVLREKAELMDPTPLFFPTEWNYGQRPLSQRNLKQPGQVFKSFEPRLPLSDKGIELYGVEPAPGPEKLVDVLVQGNEAPFAGMGQIDAQRSTLPVRSGFLEIRGYKNSNIIKSEQLGGINPPRTDIAPIEFMVVVGSAGLIGEPVLTSGSGWDEVDIFFRNYLVKTYRLGERLYPGQYRVVVGS
jgi:hypothetical protein